MEEEGRKTRRIVVAVDESKESMEALSWCLGHLVNPENPDNIVIVLLYVKPPPPVYSYFDAAEFLFSGDMVAAMEKYSNDLVHAVMDRAEAVYGSFSSRINVEKVVGRGDPKDVICHTVKKLNADMLVMGSHGYGFMMRALLGSVSEHCAKNVKCPVVIVNHHGDPITTSSPSSSSSSLEAA
ncbi:hypothetical protein SAY87_020012 [Trapa incisa]|uniref:UspA domain-containing protein n=2 Tax=Trapa TaxID=22665 RepID=A0AAN7LUB4_TRANT|nr:hypothetical protein SAY87_020012 [Trapa incisa]KAK4792896.1 hypothetical protein SAY86_023331 [Trapa natans]